MAETANFIGLRGEPTYDEARRANMQLLRELEAEHRQMKAEMAALEDAQRTSFVRTLTAWRARELQRNLQLNLRKLRNGD
jgi:hypothetical protein